MIARVSYLAAQYLHARAKRGKFPDFRVIPATTFILTHAPELARRARVLDVGPRSVREVELLEAQGWQVDAFDLFPTDPRIRRADMARLPVAPASYDLAFLSHALEHAQDLRAAADEIGRVVRPGGHVYVEVPLGAEPNRHDRHRFDGPDDVVRAFVASRPHLVASDVRGGALRVLLRLDRPLRVGLVLPDDLHVRNWVASGLLAMLQARGHHVTVFAPARCLPCGASMHEALDWLQGGRLRRWLRRDLLRTAVFVARRHSPVYRLKLALRRRRARRYTAQEAFWRAVYLVVNPERVARWVDRHLPLARRARRALEDHAIDVLVVATPLVDGAETELAHAARRLRIPVIGQAATYDCLISKGAWLGYRPDRLLVWGEQAKREAMALHDFEPSQVVVTGPPQYDAMVSPDADPRHEALGQPFVLVAGTTQAYWAGERDLVRLLGQATDEGRIKAQIVYRPHPMQRETGWVCELPGVTLDPFWSPGWRWQAAEFSGLAWLLRHAACVVSGWSTLVLEAALLDTPSILVGFEGAAALGDWPHIEPLKSWPGITVAKDPADVLRRIEQALRCPSHTSDPCWVCGAWKSPLGFGLPSPPHALPLHAQRIARFDGRARERICGAIEAAVGRASA